MAGQLFVTDTLGGLMYSDNLSAKLREVVQPMLKYRQFADVKDASQQGLGKGDTYHWNIYSNVATQGTTLSETNTVPETNFTITQGTLTITEFANSVPYTGKLEDLAEHSVTEIINKALKNDAAKALETAAHAQFDATLLVVEASDGTDTAAVLVDTDGTVTSANNIALRKGHVLNIVDEMKERDIPPYSSGDYFCIGRPKTFSTLKVDLESVYQYLQPGVTMIMNGEIGRYAGCRFVEQTGIASEGWTNALSDVAYFFGEDTVAEAIAIPEEIRAKIPTDFGRSKGIAWLKDIAKKVKQLTLRNVVNCWKALASKVEGNQQPSLSFC